MDGHGKDALGDVGRHAGGGPCALILSTTFIPEVTWPEERVGVGQATRPGARRR